MVSSRPPLKQRKAVPLLVRLFTLQGGPDSEARPECDSYSRTELNDFGIALGSVLCLMRSYKPITLLQDRCVTYSLKMLRTAYKIIP